MSQLKRTEEAMAAERKRTARWLAKHSSEGELPPAKRLDTGESAYVERSDQLARVLYEKRPGARLWFPTTSDVSGPARAFSYSTVEELDGTEANHGLAWLEGRVSLDMLSAYGPRSDAQLEKSARVAHVLTYLTDDQVELLEERFWLDGGRTLQAMADDRKVSRQAMHQRMKRVLAAFAHAWDLYGQDSVEWESE